MKTTLNSGESLIFNGTRLTDVHSYDPDTREVTYYERHYRTGEKITDALDPTGYRTLTEIARTLEIQKPPKPVSPDKAEWCGANPFDPYDPVYMGVTAQNSNGQLWVNLSRKDQPDQVYMQIPVPERVGDGMRYTALLEEIRTVRSPTSILLEITNPILGGELRRQVLEIPIPGCREQHALHQVRHDFVERLDQFRTQPFCKRTAEQIAHWAADTLQISGIEHYQVKTRLFDAMNWHTGERSYCLFLHVLLPNLPRLRLTCLLQKPETVEPDLKDWQCLLTAGAFENLDLEPQIQRFGGQTQITSEAAKTRIRMMLDSLPAL